MKIHVTSVFVENQAKALDFYAHKLGFKVKHDIAMNQHRWLTLVSPEDMEGTELLLEPSKHPAAKAYKTALFNDGIPVISFKTDNLDAEYERLLALGVPFTQKPMDAGTIWMAVINDTCGNLIQIIQPKNT